MNILFAGRLLTITHEDESTEEIKVRQLRLAEYERAFTMIEDEIALTAYACDRAKEWITGNRIGTADATSPITPESYEQLHTEMEEVNKIFFAWSARRQKREGEIEERRMLLLGGLPPETQKMVLQMGSASLAMLRSPR